MTVRRIVAAGACVGALVWMSAAGAAHRQSATAPESAAQETGRLRLHYVQKPIGEEQYTIAHTPGGDRLTATFDFTDRGGRVELNATLETTPDLTPTTFRAKGRSYRFVNVDSEVRADGDSLIVRADGKDRRVARPPAWFTVDGYAPFSAQLLLVRYWQRHGRPHTLATVPGLPTDDVIVEERGRETFHVGARTVPLAQFVIDGVVWGRETLWVDERGALAAAITRAGGLSFEAVRDDLEPALADLVRSATRDRLQDLAAISRAVAPVHEGTYALVGATIVDGTGAPAIPDGAVVVRDGRIAAVGPRAAVAVPAGVTRVDVSGKTIAPGLWDMHTHATQVEWGPVYLAAGVTTVRDMGNEFDFITAFRDAIASQRVLGPRMLAAGLVDGSGPNAFGLVYADTADEAKAVVARYHEATFEQIKIYSLVTPPVVSALVEAAHGLGMTVTGHVPNALAIDTAVEAGMDQIAHLAIRGEAGSDEVRHTIGLLKAHGTVMDPTQSWNELLGHAAGTDVTAFQPGFAKIPPPLQRLFASAAVAGIDAATARARLERGLRLVRALQQAGVPVVAGTDEGVPGHSVYREIELYNEAGFSPMEALQAATLVPARAMKLDRELGTIERGKRADLIVLDRNPLEAVRHIRSVRWTISGGRMYETAALWRSVRFQP